MTSTSYSARVSGRLRLPSSPAERRLLRGYGPLAGLLLAFVLMALFVPTVPPQQVAINQSGGNGYTGNSGAAGTPGTAGAPGTAGTPGTAGAPGTAGTGGTASGAPASSGGGSTGAAQVVASRKQIPGDPYSPPYIAFSGNNGGATAQGVTPTCIDVSFRTTSDMTTFQQQLAAKGGAQYGDTVNDIVRTANGLANYFNKNFQFYGRKLCVKPFGGEGSLLNELVGGGQQQADVDAQSASTQFPQGTFAELDGQTVPYDSSLTRHHIMSFGLPYLSATYMQSQAPYMWSIATECNDVANAASEFQVKDLPPGAADFAGGSLKGKPRKYGVIVPDISYYNDCLDSALQYQAAHGEAVASADDIRYGFIVSSFPSEAQAAIAKLQSDGVTTIACGCDPLFPIYLSDQAASQGYFPEWVVVGVALTDTSIVGQLDSQPDWAHALGISFSGNELNKEATLGYAAYKSVNSDEPANEVDLIYAQMYEMAIGIQMAGPDLTPQTFEAGMRAYPGSTAGATNAEFGTWAFPPGHFTPQTDSQIICWDPQGFSQYTQSLPNPKPGAYYRSPERYASGQLPTSTPCPSYFPRSTQ